MADPSSNVIREWHGNLGKAVIATYPMPANTRLWNGSLVQKNASTGQIELVNGSSAQFLGILDMEADNRTGGPMGGAAGAMAPVVVKGAIWVTVVKGSALAHTDVTTTVYASDGDTVTTTAGTNSSCGKILAVDPAAIGANSGRCLVAFEGQAMRSI